MSLTIAGKSVGKMGMGLMNFTWGNTVPQAEAIQTIKESIDSGISILNTASFYGPPENPAANLHLLRAFFEQQPGYADKVVLTVKGGIDFGKHQVSGKLDFLRQDIQQIQQDLGDRKKVDVYVIARQPDDVTPEELAQNVDTLRQEGHCKGIGLSEVKADTIRRVAAVAPVLAIENELSLFHLDPPVLEAVQAATELGIPFTAYSPLGRGTLTQRYKSLDELPKDDIRRKFPRFQGDNFAKNLELGDKVRQLAEKKGVSVAQMGLAYIMALSDVVVPLQGSTNIDRIKENIGALDVILTQEEIGEIKAILDTFEIAGDRYYEAAQAGLMK